MGFVIIGSIDEASGLVVVGSTRRNPCLDYVDYLEEHHPDEFTPSDLHDMRRTYSAGRDPETERSCYYLLRTRIKQDRGR